MSDIGRDLNERATVDKFRQALETRNVLALDVRESDEYRYEHIEKTMSAPLSQLQNILETLPKEKEIFVLCQTGVRTVQAVNLMHTAGFRCLHAVEGGIQAWKAAGFRVERQKSPIPIMRQVQITAGSIILVGEFVPGLHWIAVVVGAGLIFAGISGICGLAFVLSKLPWNKRKPGQEPCRTRIRT